MLNIIKIRLEIRKQIETRINTDCGSSNLQSFFKSWSFSSPIAAGLQRSLKTLEFVRPLRLECDLPFIITKIRFLSWKAPLACRDNWKQKVSRGASDKIVGFDFRWPWSLACRDKDISFPRVPRGLNLLKTLSFRNAIPSDFDLLPK